VLLIGALLLHLAFVAEQFQVPTAIPEKGRLHKKTQAGNGFGDAGGRLVGSAPGMTIGPPAMHDDVSERSKELKMARAG
jgi:hypothetical protein